MATREEISAFLLQSFLRCSGRHGLLKWVAGDEQEAQVSDDGKECRAPFIFGFLYN